MSFVHLFREQGWDFYWDPPTGRMYARQPRIVLDKTHHFRELTRNRASAIALAQAWLRG